MKRNFIATLVILMLGWTTGASAFALVESADDSDHSHRQMMAMPHVFQEGTYILTEARDLLPRSVTLRSGEVSEDPFFITIPANVPFHLSVNGSQVTLTQNLDESDVATTPSSFIFEYEDLVDLPLAGVGKESLAEFFLNFKTIAGSVIAGECKTLTEHHLGFHVNGVCTTQTTPSEYIAVGFTPVSCSSPSAILKTWGGGHRVGSIAKCGHMAWRRGNTWTSGDFTGDPGKNYFVLGCYARGHK